MSLHTGPSNLRRIYFVSDCSLIVESRAGELAELGLLISKIEMTNLLAGSVDSHRRDLFMVQFNDSQTDLAEIVRQIRIKTESAGIVCILGKDNPFERLSVAQAGADHCFSKSTPAVLIGAAVKALMRRL
jgi:DNA-binding NarL/FixJ family response regulator